MQVLEIKHIIKFSKSVRFYLILFITILILINIRQYRIKNWGCEICADKAGYYMYLPAVFHLGFKASNYPEDFHEKIGKSIIIDRENNKVITKYTSGLALLWAPFYGLGVIIAKVFSLEVEPYSYYYLFFINIGAALFAVLGLFFFRKWLEFYVDPTTSLITMIVVFIGTNLYYYTLDESLMSHMYGFSLLSISLFSIKSYLIKKKFIYFLLLATSISIAISIRPTNALYIFIIFLFDIGKWEDIKKKIIALATPKNIICAISILFIILLPQIIYWKFAFGKYILWTYQGEGFINWHNPKFGLVWFAPQSGLFIYTPILSIPLIYALIMLIKRIPNGAIVLISFIIVSYMCAAWSTPTFGPCNFGKRAMVEYLPIFMFPYALLLQSYKNFSPFMKYFITISSSILILYNLVLFTNFNTCFPGDFWEWDRFWDFFI